MKQKQARPIKITVAHIKSNDNRLQKNYTTSAVCLPKKPPNIPYLLYEHSRHKSKKSVNQNFNLINISDTKSISQRDFQMSRDTSKTKIIQKTILKNSNSKLIQKIKIENKIQQKIRRDEKNLFNHILNEPLKNKSKLRERQRSISINLNNYQTLRTQASINLKSQQTDRLHKEISTQNQFVKKKFYIKKKESVNKIYNQNQKTSFSGTKFYYTKKVSTSRLCCQLEIKKFQQKISEFQRLAQNQEVAMIIKRQHDYTSLPYFSCYLDKKQKNITWMKRAVLIYWMMEVLTDYGGKRETLNIALSMIARYLCLTPNFALNKLQLIGTTALFIAYKLEQQNKPTVQIFSEISSYNFSADQIIQFEKQMLSKLKWEINPPNLNTWSNFLTVQWDLYLKKQQWPQFEEKLQLITFKYSDQTSYYNYRFLVQMLDFAVLQIHTLKYKSRALVASLMYLLVGLRLDLFKIDEVVQNFPRYSKYLFDINNPLNQYYNGFLEYSFGISLSDLLPTIQYCSSFFILPLSFQIPQKVKNTDKILYAEFCAFQTLNKADMIYIQKKKQII